MANPAGPTWRESARGRRESIPAAARDQASPVPGDSHSWAMNTKRHMETAADENRTASPGRTAGPTANSATAIQGNAAANADRPAGSGEGIPADARHGAEDP